MQPSPAVSRRFVPALLVYLATVAIASPAQANPEHHPLRATQDLSVTAHSSSPKPNISNSSLQDNLKAQAEEASNWAPRSTAPQSSRPVPTPSAAPPQPTVGFPEAVLPQPEVTSEHHTGENVIPTSPEVKAPTAIPIAAPEPPLAAPTVTHAPVQQNQVPPGQPTEAITTAPDRHSPADLDRDQMLIDADHLYATGQTDAAAALYRQAKGTFTEDDEPEVTAPPYTDPELLPPAGQVYWRESAAGLEQDLQTRALVPAELMVNEIPEFVPGHLRYAEALRKYDRLSDGLAVLERASAQFPSHPNLQKGLIEFQAASEKWLEASITARQFALLNPQHPQAEEFMALADQYHETFRKTLRRKITGGAVTGVFTGALGVVLTGNPLSAVSPIHSSVLLLRGEQSVGNSATRRAKKKLEMIDDPTVQAYIDRIGQKLVAVAGRSFEYEFFVVKDEQLNAFAFPGGKVFVNAGAIAKANSEAELAGLMAHELAHTVLSHGFQQVTDGNATNGLASLLPFGSLFSNLALTDYSHDMEEQADLLGTRMLHSAGYAADGLRNLMNLLQTETANQPKPPRWLSTHPRAKQRIRYLEEVIERNGYNRYAYEGISEHRQIQTLLKTIMTESAETDADETTEATSEANRTPQTDVSKQ